jgi:hypothetical protein
VTRSYSRPIVWLAAAGAAAATLAGQAARPTPPSAPAVSPAAAGTSPARKWRMQYFYDQDKSFFNIVDLQFPSAQRGVAVGVIVEGNHRRPAEVVTSDGGAHWQQLKLEEPPVSLYFLNEGLGWMVTTRGLWQTTEAGKNWRKLPHLPGQIFRVYFTDEKNGFAAGVKKKLYETHDGGQHWRSVPAAAEPPGNPDRSSYTWISFANPLFGIVTGWNMPPERFQRLPDWVDPAAALNRRDTPHLSYSLVTNDGGKSWKSNAASLFGQVTRVRFGPAGTGLGLIEYSNSFRYPSEVYRIDWKTGRSETVYRDRHFAVSDIWLTPDGTAYLAGTQVTGEIRDVVPGKVMVLRSQTPEMAAWTEMPVDYRANANDVFLAVVDDNNMWLATDAGMILKLE